MRDIFTWLNDHLPRMRWLPDLGTWLLRDREALPIPKVQVQRSVCYYDLCLVKSVIALPLVTSFWSAFSSTASRTSKSQDQAAQNADVVIDPEKVMGIVTGIVTVAKFGAMASPLGTDEKIVSSRPVLKVHEIGQFLETPQPKVS